MSSERNLEMYLLTSQADDFIDNISETDQRRVEFQEEFRQLSNSQQQILRGVVQGGCYPNLPLSRAQPCDRAQNADSLMAMIKALVSRERWPLCRCSA